MNKLITFLVLLLGIGSLEAQETYSFNLDEAVQYALEHNYTVRNAALDIEAAEKQKWEATSFGLPQIDGTIDYQNWYGRKCRWNRIHYLYQRSGNRRARAIYCRYWFSRY